MTCGPSDSCVTACSTAAFVSGAVTPSAEWKITFEVFSVCWGKRSSIASAARCDSAPGSVKLSSGCPPTEMLSIMAEAASSAHTARTRHGCRPAKWPMR